MAMASEHHKLRIGRSTYLFPLGSILLLGASPPVNLPNPLAPALNGDLQCYQPNETTKTCASIAAYRSIDSTHYSNPAVVLLSKAGPITLETITPVEVVGDAVCGAITAKVLAAGKIQVAGKPLGEKDAIPLLAQIAESMGPLIGKQICTKYVSTTSGLTAKVSIDGVYTPAMDQRVKWVRPAEGYIVAP